MGITLFISYVSLASILCPLWVAVIQWSKLPKEISPLRWILIVSLLSDVLSLIVIRFSMSSYPLGNIYLFIQFTVLFYILSFRIKNKISLVVVYGLYVLFYSINVILFQSFFEFNTNSIVVSSLILIFLSTNYLYRLLSELPTVYVHKLPMLWLTFAVLIYYAGTLFLFLANNYLVRVLGDSHSMIWILHNILNISKNILFAVALWQSYRTTKSST